MLHHRDTLQPLGTGVALLALVLNPISLKGMCSTSRNQQTFREALSLFGLSQSLATIICTTPDKFLYPGVLECLKSKSTEIAEILCSIISKADVLSSPEKSLDELEEVLS